MPVGVNERGQNLVEDRLYQGKRVIETSVPYVKKEITREAQVDPADYAREGYNPDAKTISDTERRNMGREFEISRLMDGLLEDYNDEYSGFMSTNLSEMALAAGRRGIKYDDMAEYMTRYQDWKNLVRNSLFGSQLTKPEMAEFDKTAINPAFSADHNKKILARQKELLNRGKNRAIVSLKAKGFTDEMIRDFEQPESSGNPTIDSQEEYDALKSGDTYIDKADGKLYRKP